jgi:tetratricopeptide (TPR) repeat protein
MTFEVSRAEDAAAQVEALYGLGALDLKMGAHVRAAQFLSQVIEIQPEHPSAYYAYSQALMRLGRPEEAKRALEIHMRLLAEREPTGPVATRE